MTRHAVAWACRRWCRRPRRAAPSPSSASTCLSVVVRHRRPLRDGPARDPDDDAAARGGSDGQGPASSAGGWSERERVLVLRRGFRRHPRRGRLPRRGADLARGPRPGEGRARGLLDRLPRADHERGGVPPPGQELAGAPGRRRVGRHHLAQGVRRPRRHRDAEHHLGPGGQPVRRHRQQLRGRHRHGRAHHPAPRHRRAEGALPAARCCAATRCGASSSASPTPARTWPTSAPGPCATATSASSPARRCGPPAPPTRDWGILLARTDPDAPKHKGITYFLVDMKTPGFDIRPLKQMTGSEHFNEVFMDEVRIPAENVLGEVNGGWGCAITTLSQRARPDRRRQQEQRHRGAHRAGPEAGRVRRPDHPPAPGRLLDPPADPALPRLPAADGALARACRPAPRPRS